MTEFVNPTPVTALKIEPEPSDVNDVLKDKGRYAGDAVDWVVSTFCDLLGFGDQGLYDRLVLPISGDFNRIKANGKAWGDVGVMLAIVQQNMRQNATSLVTSDWSGNAAKAFFGHIDVVLIGGLYVAEKCCSWMQKGFEKLADLSIKIARKCAALLDDILTRIGKLAAKGIPIIGTIWTVVEWVASGFDRTPYLADAQEIVKLVQQVIALHETLTEVVAGIQKYYDAFQAAVDAVKKIPEIKDTDDAAQVAKDFNGSREEMKKARADVDKNAGGMQKQLDDLSAQVDKVAGP